MTDKELLDMLLKDPPRGLEETVRAYTPYVMKIVRVKLSGICGSEDIEETVSDIFMMLYRRVGQYGREVRSLKALLAVIARRRCADVYEQKLKQRDNLSREELSENLPAETSAMNRAELIEAIKSLGQPDEQIFIRKYFFGQKSSEIAADLDMKTNTVDKRISRGLKKLREMMEVDR